MTFAGKVEAALDELRPLVQGDGADLSVCSVDADGRQVSLRLDLDNVSCLECVMPPDFLRDVIVDALRQRLGECQVTLDDPREGQG